VQYAFYIVAYERFELLRIRQLRQIIIIQACIFNSLKKKKKNLQNIIRKFTREFTRKLWETKQTCARAFFTHGFYARVHACAAVLREIERPGCVPGEPNAVRLRLHELPIGRDNGNNAIGASARDIGARRPYRCAWASMTWLALITIAPLICAVRGVPGVRYRDERARSSSGTQSITRKLLRAGRARNYVNH